MNIGRRNPSVMDAQRELLELAKEMLGYSDLTPEQIEWAARIETLATTLAAREDGWRPIESAPKDGRKLLLCHLSNEPFTGYWRGVLGWVDGYGMRDPTHWQPLPAAPPAQGEKS